MRPMLSLLITMSGLVMDQMQFCMPSLESHRYLMIYLTRYIFVGMAWNQTMVVVLVGVHTDG